MAEVSLSSYTDATGEWLSTRGELGTDVVSAHIPEATSGEEDPPLTVFWPGATRAAALGHFFTSLLAKAAAPFMGQVRVVIYSDRQKRVNDYRAQSLAGSLPGLLDSPRPGEPPRLIRLEHYPVALTEPSRLVAWAHTNLPGPLPPTPRPMGLLLTTSHLETVDQLIAQYARETAYAPHDVGLYVECLGAVRNHVMRRPQPLAHA